MAEFLAYRILIGKLTIDRVPAKLRVQVQKILDETLGKDDSTTR